METPNALALVGEQLQRLSLGGVNLNEQQMREYIGMEADLGEAVKGSELAPGFKRCGSCGHAKKFFLFNKNTGSKTNTSGNCKECQKGTAAQSYSKTKSKRNYKKYYQENKETKQAHARKYYTENKDTIKDKHKAYLATSKGQKVMRQAHSKRRKAIAENKGIPYTREMVIERDGKFLGFVHPVCYLCNNPITDISGAELHLDHVVPIVEQGLDCFSNVASSHRTCNLTREKDARRLTVEQVDGIIKRAESYIDTYPDRFED